MANELLHELTRGVAQFTIVGKVNIGADTFKGVIQPEKGNWVSVRTTIPIEAEEGVRIFPDINDGYKNNEPIIKRFPQERGAEMIQIPFKDRLSEDIVEKVARYTLFRTNITKDENGKPISTSFIHGIDFENFLSKHLKDGMEVTIRGDVEYSLNKDRDREYRNYRIKSVFLNEDYEVNGEVRKAAKHSATITQTYLAEAGALDKRWETELETTGKTQVVLYVPQYMGKLWNGQTSVDFRKTIPIRQVVTLSADPNDEKSLKRTKILAKKLFDVPKKKVRELGLILKINEGYERGTGTIQIDDELQELIDLGLMNEEDVTRQVTVQGNRVSELVVVSPRVLVNSEGKTQIDMSDEKYAADALVFPEIDQDDFDVVEEESAVSVDEGMSDDLFDDLFGGED